MIVTHDGPCHADEIVACAILRKVNPGAVILRSRRPEDIEAAQYVVDVGEKYDGFRSFDHHQKVGKPEPRATGVPYASAGLVLRDLGLIWLNAVCPAHGVDPVRVLERIDRSFVQAIDAKDNGKIDLAATLAGTGLVLPTNDFNSFMRLFFPSELAGEALTAQDALFEQAVGIAGVILDRVLVNAIAEEKSDAIVTAADRFEAILVLDQPCAWVDAVSARPHIALVVLPGSRGDWILCTVKRWGGRQDDVRQALPPDWAGLKGEALCQAAGVSDLTLCPPTGHCLFAKTREAAIQAAQRVAG